MQVGTYADGRELTYDQPSNSFAVGGTPVTVAQVLEYDAYGQIQWQSEELRAWAHGLGNWAAAQAIAVATPQPHPMDVHQFGPVNPALLCPHCQTRGVVHTKMVKQKKGVSGGKATAALLTGGVSILATGLSRKEQSTQAHCGNCGSTWHF